MRRIKKYSGCFMITMISVFICISMAQVQAADQQADKLRIAALLPLSGGAVQWGVGILRGAELMIDKINEEGGIKVGDKKYLIELIKSDTKSKPDTALAQVNRLVFNYMK